MNSVSCFHFVQWLCTSLFWVISQAAR